MVYLLTAPIHDDAEQLCKCIGRSIRLPVNVYSYVIVIVPEIKVVIEITAIANCVVSCIATDNTATDNG